MALDIKRFTARFVEEARDHLLRLEEGLNALRNGASDPETVNSIFRSAHTIKGSSSMLKMTPISNAAHRVEDVLGALREGKLTYTGELGRLLQRGADALAAQVEEVAAGVEPAVLDAVLCAELTHILGDGDKATEIADETPALPKGQEPVADIPNASTRPDATPGLQTSESVRIPLARLDRLVKLMGEMVSSHARLRQRVSDCRSLEHVLVATGDGHPVRLGEFANALKEDVLAQEAQMEELHMEALILRMLPLSTILDAAPRTVRELARSIGKEVECNVSGREIELDRQLIDRLGDPILHLLRNAVDHGIETPDERRRAGKPERGRIDLRVRQDEGSVVIEVSDDGRGLSLDAIRAKALKQGLVNAEQAALSETEVADLIFLPGFSTSPIITDISGRGVGMDVVKRCVVDELHGSIHLETKPGSGLKTCLRLPRSLAVMRVLLVSAGGRMVGFTAPHVCHLLQIQKERLLEVAQRQALNLDNELIPVVGLAELLSLDESPAREELLLVIVQAGKEKLALRVDSLVDERNLVIKPLPAHLEKLSLVSGVVMTGKSELVSVLQAPALIALAQRGNAGGKPAARTESANRVRVLVVDDSLNTREIEKDVLEAHGYHVTLAEDGLDGLEKARNNRFDAVLTDVEMPNMDGFTLTATLRQEENYRDVPIIIITSRQKETDRRRGIQVGADAYIVKGDFDQNHLVDTLKSLLG